MESVSTFFKEEDDVFYKKGQAIGEAKGRAIGEARGKAAVVENLLIKLGFSDEKAAEIAEVSVEFVKKVRASITK